MVCLASLLLLSACSEGARDPLYGGSGTGIINGLEVRDANPLAKSVVQLWTQAEGMSLQCGGTLIAEDIVLTAAHCVQTAGHPEDITIDFSVNVPLENGSVSYQAVGFLIHPSFDFSRFESGGIILNGSDLALIKFNGLLPSGYRPIEILKAADLVTNKSVIHMYGYGANKIVYRKIDKPQDIPDLEEYIKMGYVICNEDRTSCRGADLLSPSRLLRGVSHRVVSDGTDFVINYEDFKFGICTGDSGGPAFVKNQGQYYLYGVASRIFGDELCKGYAIYTNVTKYQAWIAQTIEKLKKAPENQKPLKKD